MILLVGRFHIGLAIAASLRIGTLFTLFVVPTFYLLLAPNEGLVGEEGRESGVPDTIA